MATEIKLEALASGGRGPSYPFIDLGEAISRAQKFYDIEGKNAAPVVAAIEHWGYGAKSSGGRQTVSTLIQYSLMRDEGSGDQRQVGLSKRALDILLSEKDSPQRLDAIRLAARSPKLFSQILEKYQPAALPSDTTLKHYLVTELNVNTNAVEGVIKNFRATVAYAKLSSSDSIPPKGSLTPDKGAEDLENNVEIGDFVQWEIDGVKQFEIARRVRAVQAHDGVDWVFVDGSDTGIPMEEVTAQVKGVAIGKPIVPPVLAEQPGRAAEREWLRGPLSKEISYRLLVSGEMTPKEIGKLIKLLEAQKAVLGDEEDPLA